MKIRTKYYVNPQKPLTLLAAGFMLLSVILRLTWCIVWPSDLAERGFWLHGALPMSSCGLFILFLLLCGRDRLWLTALPTLMGVLFFLCKAGTFVWWHQLLCTILYLAVAALYGLTVSGVFPLRRLLVPLFGLPLAFHIFVEDLTIHRTVYTYAQWFQEWSVLCIMAGLLCIAFAMQEAPKEQ